MTGPSWIEKQLVPGVTSCHPAHCSTKPTPGQSASYPVTLLVFWLVMTTSKTKQARLESVRTSCLSMATSRSTPRELDGEYSCMDIVPWSRQKTIIETISGLTFCLNTHVRLIGANVFMQGSWKATLHARTIISVYPLLCRALEAFEMLNEEFR